MDRRKDYLYCNCKGSNAMGHFAEDGKHFVVLKGSVVASAETKSCLKSTRSERAKLIADGSIVGWKLTRDIEFRGISHACRIVTGGHGDGNGLWKDYTGTKYQLSDYWFPDDDFIDSEDEVK